jgi:hypothetical protein
MARTFAERSPLHRDRGLPAFFLRALPNGALWAACALYLGLAVIIYASSGFSLAQSSNVFSMSFVSPTTPITARPR